MELRQYGRILWKRAWLIAALTLIAGVTSFLISPAREGYEATLRVAIGVQPEERRDNLYQYDRYYAFLASEYLADDFGEVVKSRAFLEDVQKELGNTPIALGSIFGDRGAKKTHRLVTLTVTAKGQEQARQIADAVLRVMENKGNQYLAQLGSDRAVVRVVDPPEVYPASRGQRALLDLGLRTGLGLLAGLALVLLLEYLDNTVRDRTEAEGVLGLTVLGELPPE
ncbi:MAG: Wzz/FepE/Etk N-terminal domain-containing protein [Dehalococcoidia bacterium]|nr:Wzz/FepE/Etk N-terminal domain-containing protein [Dehalococcoidia bacterium]